MIRLICRAGNTNDVSVVDGATLSLTEIEARDLLCYFAVVEDCIAVDACFYFADFADELARFGTINGDKDDEVDYGTWYPHKDLASITLKHQRIDLPTLRVKADGVMWTGRLRDVPGVVETETVTWDELKAVAAGRNPW